MDLETLRAYCIAKKGTTEEFPFDNSTLVFKVAGKIFALTNIDSEVSAVNLKCDPERAAELRETYESVGAGYHMNKKHWNTVLLRSTVSDTMLASWIDHSYDLVLANLPKKLRENL